MRFPYLQHRDPRGTVLNDDDAVADHKRRGMVIAERQFFKARLDRFAYAVVQLSGRDNRPLGWKVGVRPP